MALVLGGGERVNFLPVTNGTTPTIGALAISITQVIGVDVSKDGSGVPTITVNQAQADSALITFLETAQDLTVSSDTEELVYEAGTKVSSTSTAQQYLTIVRGGIVSGGIDDGKRLFWAGLTTIANESGSWSQEANTYDKLSLLGNGVALEGTLSIASTLLTNFMTTPATVSIPVSLKYGRTFVG